MPTCGCCATCTICRSPARRTGPAIHDPRRGCQRPQACIRGILEGDLRGDDPSRTELAVEVACELARRQIVRARDKHRGDDGSVGERQPDACAQHRLLRRLQRGHHLPQTGRPSRRRGRPTCQTVAELLQLRVVVLLEPRRRASALRLLLHHLLERAAWSPGAVEADTARGRAGGRASWAHPSPWGRRRERESCGCRGRCGRRSRGSCGRSGSGHDRTVGPPWPHLTARARRCRMGHRREKRDGA